MTWVACVLYENKRNEAGKGYPLHQLVCAMVDDVLGQTGQWWASQQIEGRPRGGKDKLLAESLGTFRRARPEASEGGGRTAVARGWRRGRPAWSLGGDGRGRVGGDRVGGGGLGWPRRYALRVMSRRML